MIRLVFVEGASCKFWQAEQTGKDVLYRWGRIGTAGQEKKKRYKDAAAASAELGKLEREKRGKGYEDEGKPAARRRGKRSPELTALLYLCKQLAPDADE